MLVFRPIKNCGVAIHDILIVFHVKRLQNGQCVNMYIDIHQRSQGLWLPEPVQLLCLSHSEGTHVGVRYSYAETTPPWTRRHQAYVPVKSDHYLQSSTASVVAVDALVSLALAAKIFRRMMLASVTAVPATHHRVPQPGVATGSQSRGIDK